MASTSRTSRRWVRFLVVLKAMYSSRCEAPAGSRRGGRQQAGSGIEPTAAAVQRQPWQAPRLWHWQHGHRAWACCGSGMLLLQLRQ